MLVFWCKLTWTPIHDQSWALFRRHQSFSLQDCLEWQHRHKDPTKEDGLRGFFSFGLDGIRLDVIWIGCDLDWMLFGLDVIWIRCNLNCMQFGLEVSHLLNERCVDIDILVAYCYLPHLTRTMLISFPLHRRLSNSVFQSFMKVPPCNQILQPGWPPQVVWTSPPACTRLPCATETQWPFDEGELKVSKQGSRVLNLKRMQELFMEVSCLFDMWVVGLFSGALLGRSGFS